MEKLNVIINAGSATYKYTLFDDEEELLHVVYEKKGEKRFTRTILRYGKTKTSSCPLSVFSNSLKDFLHLNLVVDLLQKRKLSTLGFRVVHGGHFFHNPTRVTKTILRKLKQLDTLAPLHNPYARKLIEQSERLLPKTQKVLFFDTAFHHDMPEVNWRYGIPKQLADKHHLRRYGFHGIVCSSIVHQLRQKRKLKKRVIICHLGSGCSVTAVKNGMSVSTSMGFTPLEGLLMSTRAGDLDPGLVLHLAKQKGVSLQKIEKLLQEESGLFGLTRERDMRSILKKANKGNPTAHLALEMFCRKAAEHIAKGAVSLEGLDHIIFSGGIGENAPHIREIICKQLKVLKVKINSQKNARAQAGKFFNKRLSSVKLSWMHADEASEMNRVLVSS